MADADTKTTEKVTATLIRGRYFDYKGQVWDSNKGPLDNKGRPYREIDKETEAYLRQHAFEDRTVDGENHSLPRFEFSGDAPKVRSRRASTE